MTKLIATSVVRGARQGESHGGVFLIDIDSSEVEQTVDWNTMNIDWQGRGWDRGLRGIAFDGDRVYIAASDELFVYDRNFSMLSSYRCRYLKHCHEISSFKRRLYLTSTGFDSVLGFDLDQQRFSWGLHIGVDENGYVANAFDPEGSSGPQPGNSFHLNSVYALEGGLYFSGLRTLGLLKFDGRGVRKIATLPRGVHNAQPFRGGILFNDSDADVVRFESPRAAQHFAVPRYAPDTLTHTELSDPRIARQAFGRGLCVVDEAVVAAGSSPSTVALHDLETGRTAATFQLSRDIRNAIHGLEVWPYDS